MTQPLTDEQLAEIVAMPTGKDIDTLAAEIRRLRARTLTESEHNRAWHAIEGAAGEEGADPGTVLNAVLRALGINPPAEETHVVADDSSDPEPSNRPCGHDDYHDPHEWADRPSAWCPGISYADDDSAARP